MLMSIHKVTKAEGEQITLNAEGKIVTVPQGAYIAYRHFPLGAKRYGGGAFFNTPKILTFAELSGGHYTPAKKQPMGADGLYKATA